MPSRRFTRAEFEAAWNAGGSQRDVAQRLGVSAPVVTVWAQKYGFRTQGQVVRFSPLPAYYQPTSLSRHWWPDALDMARRGLSNKVIARELQKTPAAVATALNRMRAGQPDVAERAAAAGEAPPRPEPAAAPSRSSHVPQHAEDRP